jgi:hypothetical protein
MMDDKAQRFQFSLRAAIIMTLVAGVVLGCVIGVVSFFNNITRAEFNLHAISATMQIVEEHIQEHDGDWPRSWEELDKIAAASSMPGRFNLEDVKKRVEIDFGARLEDLAGQDDKSFKAIRPIGPCYTHDHYVNSLLQTIRAAARAEKAKFSSANQER